MASTATIRRADKTVQGMAIGPMSVQSDRQRCGIGSQLVNDLLQRLKQASCQFVIVFGHAEYYPRFGFTAASAHGIQHAFEGLPQELLFIHVLDENCQPTIEGGTAFYDEAFGPQLTSQ